MRTYSLQTFALIFGVAVGACSSEDSPQDYSANGDSGDTSMGDTSMGGTVTAGTSAGTTGSGTPTSSATTTSSSTTTVTSATTSGTTTSGNTTGSPLGGTATAATTSSATTSGSTTTNSTTTTGGNTTGGNTTGGNTTNGNTTGFGAATTTGNTTGGNTTNSGAGGAGSTTAGSTTGTIGELDCNAAMPSGGTEHSGNSQGGSGNLAWQIWSNVGTGNMTTFSTPAFIASWNNSGDYLGRIGYEWGNSAQTYTAYGTITAQFVAHKNGSGGGYSYIGMYGWTTNPCVEWYIVDDSYNNMPVNPGNTTNKGTVDIDGGSYIMYTRNTSGTGGSRCSGVSNWVQYYSVRTTARDCGVISLTEHFDAWESLGMSMAGNLLEAKILVEVGGGQGSVEFPVANVVAQ